MPSPNLGSEDTAINKQKKSSSSHGSYILMRQREINK